MCLTQIIVSSHLNELFMNFGLCIERLGPGIHKVWFIMFGLHGGETTNYNIDCITGKLKQ